MPRDTVHALLAQPNFEEDIRQKFVLKAKRFLNSNIRSRNIAVHANDTAKHRGGHPPEELQTRDEARSDLARSPYYRLWSAANRSLQEMMWLSVGEMVLREQDRMQERYRKFAGAGADKLGTLSLDPDIESPSVAALEATHVHLQPGGYLLDRSDDDILAGALYESGGNLYSFGQSMGKRDSKAQCVARFLTADLGMAPPSRMLELGCSAGGATADYAETFPAAELHAIDLGAGLLRYAHARAEALGVGIHFHQMDCTRLAFDDESFDLVVSHNLAHEIATAERAKALAEAHRVLRPGGILVIQDVPIRLGERPVIEQAEITWDLRYNGELFWEDFADGDLIADCIGAWFARADVEEQMLPKIDGPGGWYAVIARKQ